MMKLDRWCVVGLLAFGATGCGAIVRGADLRDGAVSDQATVDAPVVTPLDAGLPTDRGALVDGGSPIDLGFPRDLGLPTDRGFPRDNNLPIDLGVDAGVRSMAGGRCASDDDCDPTVTSGLACMAHLSAGGFCSGGCDPGSRAEEAAACGGSGATCVLGSPLSLSDRSRGVCVRSCLVGRRTEATGGCRSGQVCTGYWLNQPTGEPDSPGCFPFCTEDSQCAGVTVGDVAAPRCNVRTGRCAPTPVDMTLLRDGDPCNPAEVQMTRRQPCRGNCFQITRNPVQGICGSFVNSAVTGGCPDDPAQNILGMGADDLGLCIWRDCTRNADCATGLVCRFHEADDGGGAMVVTDGPTQCNYPTALQPMGTP